MRDYWLWLKFFGAFLVLIRASITLLGYMTGTSSFLNISIEPGETVMAFGTAVCLLVLATIQMSNSGNEIMHRNGHHPTLSAA